MVLLNDYGHGGDVYHNRVRLDFSANVNPLGTPPEVVRAVAESAETLAAYPDPYCSGLREKLAAVHGVGASDVVCGNGAAELIFQFAAALRPKRALLPVPSFSEYESALTSVGCEIEYFPLRRDAGFAVTAAILDAITPETEALVLCTPNNPTGRSVDPALLERILDRCRATGTRLLLDECFLDLTEKGAEKSLIPALHEGDPCLVLRAFTKLYGMAGVRLGYAVSRDQNLLLRMCRTVQPWNVSAPAQAAGAAALDCRAFVARTLALIAEERDYLLRELRALGIEVLPGDANFLMLSGVPGLYERLRTEQGILIRSCANYRGLNEGDCRIAVRTHEENEQLIAALREIYGHA
jgi:threonine-phosphate decarboxylase